MNPDLKPVDDYFSRKIFSDIRILRPSTRRYRTKEEGLVTVEKAQSKRDRKNAKRLEAMKGQC